MRDILTIVLKEIWELKYSIKKLYLLFILFLLPIIFIFDNSRSFIPASLFPLVFVCIIAIGTSGQIAYNAILEEKRSKTLEVLLSTNMAPYSIIIGKIIPGTAIGYILSILAYIVISIVALFSETFGLLNVNRFLLIIPFFLSYFAGGISITVTIWVPDEKIAPLIGTLIIFSFLGILWYINSIFIVSNFIIFIFLIFLCALTTWLAVISLKRIPLITKI